MDVIKLVLVDYHQIIRNGLKAIFSHFNDITIVGDVATSEELMALLATQPAYVILMDINLPGKNGVKMVEEVKLKYPDTKILMNTLAEVPEEIDAAEKAGINGYILKKAGTNELIRAIKMVAEGQPYNGAASLGKPPKKIIRDKSLTDTEIKIAQMLYDGKEHMKIAEAINTTPANLKAYLQNIYKKLNIRSEAALVKHTLKEKLIK